MNKSTQQDIIRHAISIFSREGFDGLSMRRLATAVGVSVSVVYYHFPDKDALLKTAFRQVRLSLGAQRRENENALESGNDLRRQIADRVRFQLEHAEEITYIYRYYLHYRSNFGRNDRGFLPVRSSEHFEEVLPHRGSTENLSIAKFLTHAINGYVLEYFPYIEEDDIVRLSDELSSLAIRLSEKEVAM